LRIALVALQRLSVFDDPDWSLVYVRDTLDFIWVLDQCAGKVTKAAAELNLDEDHGLNRTAKKISIVSAFCRERMAAHSAGLQRGSLDYADPNFLDDTWFQDVLELFDYEPNNNTAGP
jgi:hypothetical protein